jgi:SAM-dependent methyltransferase
MKSFWDVRYDTDQFVYGRDPNHFFAGTLKKLAPGRLLLPGEGEGRNAVFAAKLGWEVDAFDQSNTGAQKARVLMKAEGVQVNYQVHDLFDFGFIPDHYDAIGLVFFHAIPSIRKFLHDRVVESLSPGGSLILEAFHTSQLGNTSGGPPDLSMLFDRNILLEDFTALEPLLLEESAITLDEGSLHRGPANVIRYIGMKSNKKA